ncbi:MAG: hypothetical protein IJI45_03545, partial [Anaerolineaceae bacterium]|nr:hypothetical protein [Anaerolineaceae bacterium]
KLADYFGVTIDDILGRAEDEEQPQQQTSLTNFDPASIPVKYPKSSTYPAPRLEKETALIPILGSVRAGYDNFAEQNIEGYIRVDESLKAVHPEAFTLRVTGDSMEPELSHGDYVICLPDAEIRNNDVAIVCINGEIGTVKRIRFDQNGLTLIPRNPKYKSIHYTPEEVETLPVTIQAKVIERRSFYS